MILDVRYAEGRAERLPALAADPVQLPVHVLVTHGPTIRPAQRATQTIPTVMAVVTDPVGSDSSPAWRGRAATSDVLAMCWYRSAGPYM
jgi:ABC-type uncharacterized transport system substrate-binding protein